MKQGDSDMVAGREDGREPPVKEYRHPLAGEKGRETDAPLEPLEGMQPYGRCGLALQNPVQTSDSQNWKIISPCCFKPLRLQRFVTAGAGN